MVCQASMAASAWLLCICLPAVGTAQADCPGITRQPVASTGNLFSQLVSGVRWSRDSLLVADAGEPAVFLIGKRGGTPRRIWREGEGPGEYRKPSVLSWAGAGRIFLYDGILQRVSLFGRDLRLQVDQRLPGVGAFRVRGADSAGGIYLDDYPTFIGRVIAPALLQGRRTGGMTESDTVPVLRRDLPTGREDTLATLVLPPRVPMAGGAVYEQPGYMDGRVPFGTRDDWALGADGQVVVLRGRDYTAEWYRPGREVRRVGPISRARVSVDEAEQDAWVAGSAKDSIILLDCRSRPCVATQVFHAPRPAHWPAVKNAFEFHSLRLSPSGVLWAKRSSSVRDEAVCYDVVSESGAVRHLRLPRGRSVLIADDDEIYAVAEDEDGLQAIETYLAR